jgi:hypothetical protein
MEGETARPAGEFPRRQGTVELLVQLPAWQRIPGGQQPQPHAT